VVGHYLSFEKIQFDVIAITKEESAYKVKHYKNLAL
jgi:hypothetical protein